MAVGDVLGIGSRHLRHGPAHGELALADHPRLSVLSGFSQGLGYAGAGIAPLFFGTIHDATGSWSASFAMLGVCMAVMMTGAVMINAKRYIEDSAAEPVESAKTSVA
ncbi:hypothetical protein NHF46_20185 [Arthrobacter alpinus]|nr:hypothetical protein [Arthrobacter alpinus]